MSINFENDEIRCVKPRQCLTTPRCGVPGPVGSIYNSPLGDYQSQDMPHLRPTNIEKQHKPIRNLLCVSRRFIGGQEAQCPVTILSPGNLEPTNSQSLNASSTGTWQFGKRSKLLYSFASLQVFEFLISYKLERKTQKGPKGSLEDNVLLERWAGKHRPSW